jgi:hypothetical protein
VQRDGVAPRIAAEQADTAGVGAEQAEQDADGGRLAGPVRPEEAVHLAGLHLEVEPVQRPRRSERLDQAADADGGRRVHGLTRG